MGADAGRDRVSILGSVRTPLGFFTLVALILDGVLAAATLTGNMPFWAPISLLFFLIAGFFIVVFFKPWVLYPPGEWPRTDITVNIIFPDISFRNLDVDKSVMEVRYGKEEQKKERLQPNLTHGPGGWSFLLVERLDSTDSVRLELFEKNGERWTVGPFAPFQTKVEAIKTVELS
jgi:hypothetical protein